MKNKIGGAHLGHVGIVMHAWYFVEKVWLLMGDAHKVVPISEIQRRKYKLNMTSGGGYMEVMVKTK